MEQKPPTNHNLGAHMMTFFGAGRSLDLQIE